MILQNLYHYRTDILRIAAVNLIGIRIAKLLRSLLCLLFIEIQNHRMAAAFNDTLGNLIANTLCSTCDHNCLTFKIPLHSSSPLCIYDKYMRTFHKLIHAFIFRLFMSSFRLHQSCY